MLGKSKTPKQRKNRFKKKPAKRGSGGFHRLVLALKLSGLMIVLLAVSALFIMGYAAVTQSDFFRAQSFEVDGISRLSRETVMIQAGLSPGVNLLAVNLHLVRKRLLGHPWIASARVTREIPETIGIHIEEHESLAIVDLGRRFLVNSQGRIFKELTRQDPQELPVIKGIRYTDISLGDDPLSPAMRTVIKLLTLSRSSKSAFTYGQIARLDYDHELGITLITRGHPCAYRLGFAPFETKYRRLVQLMPHLKRTKKWRQYQTVDLNNPDRIVVQLGSTRTPKRGA